MFISKRIIKLWLILFVPIFFTLAYGTYRQRQKNTYAATVEQNASTSKHVGSRLPILPLKDTSINPVTLKFHFERPVIIDFWFAGCSPCITEMKQFAKLLKEYPGQFEVISISIDALSGWKETVSGKSSEKLRFLSTGKDSLWTHLNLDTADAPGYLKSQLNLSGYPSYFILDNNGYIVATPKSAVDYIEKVIVRENGFIYFFRKTFSSEDGWINSLFSFLYYSGLFWSVTIFILWTSSLLKKRHSH